MRFEEVALLVMLAAILTVIVVWFRNPAGWIDVLLMIAMTGTLVLLALVMAATRPR
jgi:hypothetical protein